MFDFKKFGINDAKIDEVFDKVSDVVDDALDAAYGLVETVATEVTAALDSAREAAKERISDSGPVANSKPVRVPPDVEGMLKDVKAFYDAKNMSFLLPKQENYGPEDFKARVSWYWDTLPEDYKSWVERDKNSPL